MAHHARRIAIRKHPNIRLGPHIVHFIAHPRREPRHLAERHDPGRRRTGEVDDEYVDTLGALAREVFGWGGGFVLLCCCAVGGVLVEGEELGVFDDGEFVGSEG